MPSRLANVAAAGKTVPPAQPAYRLSRGVPLPMGTWCRRGGVNFSVFSKHATSCTLVIFQPGTNTPAVEFALDPRSNRTGEVWHGFVEGADVGTEYGYRFDMQPNPDPHVYRFDPAQAMLDPYARVLSNGAPWADFQPGKRRYRNSMVIENHFDWEDDQPLNLPLVDSVIYELHVRSFTQHPSSGVQHRGTFAGLIEKIPYLKQLGVTAVELLPVNEFEESDTDRRNPFTGEPLRNLWGYQPIAFCAPNAAYSSNLANGGQVREFKQLVRELHQRRHRGHSRHRFQSHRRRRQRRPHLVVPRHR